MIEALKATLAPSAKREKPQLSAWPAASFIKTARVLGVERVLRRRSPHSTKQNQDDGWACGYACLSWLFGTIGWIAGTTAGCRRPQPAYDGMILLIFTARLIRLFRFVSTVTIMQQRYAAALLPRWDDTDRRESAWAQQVQKNHGTVTCQRVGQTLALFPYLRRGLN
jgi:hypothetical protein